MIKRNDGDNKKRKDIMLAGALIALAIVLIILNPSGIHVSHPHTIEHSNTSSRTLPPNPMIPTTTLFNPNNASMSVNGAVSTASITLFEVPYSAQTYSLFIIKYTREEAYTIQAFVTVNKNGYPTRAVEIIIHTTTKLTTITTNFSLIVPLLKKIGHTYTVTFLPPTSTRVLSSSTTTLTITSAYNSTFTFSNGVFTFQFTNTFVELVLINPVTGTIFCTNGKGIINLEYLSPFTKKSTVYYAFPAVNFKGAPIVLVSSSATTMTILKYSPSEVYGMITVTLSSTTLRVMNFFGTNVLINSQPYKYSDGTGATVIRVGTLQTTATTRMTEVLQNPYFFLTTTSNHTLIVTEFGYHTFVSSNKYTTLVLSNSFILFTYTRWIQNVAIVYKGWFMFPENASPYETIVAKIVKQ